MATRDTSHETEPSRAELAAEGTSPRSSSGPCLPEDDILDLGEGRALEATQQARLEKHVDECSACFELVTHWLRECQSGEHEISLPGASLCVTTFRRGTVLGGRYRIERFVARGGMGEVYEALDTKLGETVALKTVVSSAADSQRAVRKLFDEVQLARRVQHRNVCRIHELHEHRAQPGTGDTFHFLTMEFIVGERLGDRIRRDGPLSLDSAVIVARQILHGLQAAHSAHVLHLDLKTDNIMLRHDTPELEAVIMDFGLSRAFDSEARLRTSEQGQIVGSLAYMAPEQLECRPTLGKAADIYAFGVVLYELLTGSVPFPAESAVAMLRKRLKERPPAPSRMRSGVSPVLDAFVLGCLSRNETHRYPNVESALSALDRALSVPVGVRRRSRAIGIAAAGIAILGLGAVGARAPRNPRAQAPQASSQPQARSEMPSDSGRTQPALTVSPGDSPASSAKPKLEHIAIDRPAKHHGETEPSTLRAGARPRPKVAAPKSDTRPAQGKIAATKPVLPGAPTGLSW